MTADSSPFAALPDWLREHRFAVRAVEPLAGDVSPRRYARVHLAGGSAVAALYPPEVASACGRFLRASELLVARGVPVPRILAADCEAGWMLVEDLGPATLYEFAERPWPELEPALAAGVDLLPRIASADREAVAALNPPLDAALLARELRQTRELLLEPLGLERDPGLARAVDEALAALCAALGGGTLVPCHRDLMPRNVVPRGPWPSTDLAVLDHQDLRLGPATYDLASWLNDSLFAPPDVEQRLLARAGLDDLEGYRRAVVQRALKATGTYLSFARRGARRHLPLVAPTLARAARHLPALPETSPTAARLAALWEPARLDALLH